MNGAAWLLQQDFRRSHLFAGARHHPTSLQHLTVGQTPNLAFLPMIWASADSSELRPPPLKNPSDSLFMHMLPETFSGRLQPVSHPFERGKPLRWREATSL